MLTLLFFIRLPAESSSLRLSSVTNCVLKQIQDCGGGDVRRKWVQGEIFSASSWLQHFKLASSETLRDPQNTNTRITRQNEAPSLNKRVKRQSFIRFSVYLLHLFSMSFFITGESGSTEQWFTANRRQLREVGLSLHSHGWREAQTHAVASVPVCCHVTCSLTWRKAETSCSSLPVQTQTDTDACWTPTSAAAGNEPRWDSEATPISETVSLLVTDAITTVTVWLAPDYLWLKMATLIGGFEFLCWILKMYFDTLSLSQRKFNTDCLVLHTFSAFLKQFIHLCVNVPDCASDCGHSVRDTNMTEKLLCLKLTERNSAAERSLSLPCSRLQNKSNP